MSDDSFQISNINGIIIIEKDDQKLSISQAVDEDIFFSTSKDELSLDISMYSRVYPEWQTYRVFESLLKSIVGRYILNDDDKKGDLWLPEDFIDLEGKVVTWHSDSGIDNILRFSYNETSITISLSKDKDGYSNSMVRIRTNGSRYEYYYQEFLEFYRNLSELEHRINKKEENIEVKTEEAPIQKKLSFFGKMKSKKDLKI